MPAFNTLLADPYSSFGLFSVAVVAIFSCLVIYRGRRYGDWDFMSD